MLWCLKLHEKIENNATFKQNYTLKLLIAFKMAYSCGFTYQGEI